MKPEEAEPRVGGGGVSIPSFVTTVAAKLEFSFLKFYGVASSHIWGKVCISLGIPLHTAAVSSAIFLGARLTAIPLGCSLSLKRILGGEIGGWGQRAHECVIAR